MTKNFKVRIGMKAVAAMVAVVMVLGVLAPSAFSQALPEGAQSSDEGAQVTPSGIEYGQLESKLKEYIEDHPVGASVSMALFDKNETICSVRHGYSHIADKIPVDENTVYEWGSTSKLLVWASVMQQYEQGKIDLNADIRTYLPDGFLTKLRFDKPITMIDVMNHQGGWQEVLAIWTEDAQKLSSLADTLKHTEPTQVFEPGATTAYSNWGAALAAYVVECVSGMDYADYVHKYILGPLDMTHTSVKGDFTDNTWVKDQYKKGDYLGFDGVASQDMYYGRIYPAGSATGTLDDFVKFAKAFVPPSEEKSPLFSDRQTLDRMLLPTSMYTGTDIARSCHGFMTAEYAVNVMGHGGNTLGFSANLMFDSQSGLGVVIMTNKAMEIDYCQGVLPYIFGDFDPDS